MLKHGTRTTQAIVGTLVERFDEQELIAHEGPESLELNEIGRISVRVAEPIVADDYAVNRHTGSFLLIDPAGGNTLAAGLVGNALAAVELGSAVPA